MSMQGFISTLLTMFVGATGPFVSIALRQRQLEPTSHAATFAAAMALQHGLKAMIFLMLGFSFAAYTPLLIGRIISGFAVTYIGAKLLAKRRAPSFYVGLKVVLTLLSLRLLYLCLNAL